MQADETFSLVLDELRADPDVSEGKMLGHRCARLGKKVFACLYEDELCARLGPERTSDLIEVGEGSAFDPMGGRPMKGWVLVGEPDFSAWLAFCDEAKRLLASEVAQPAG